MILVVILSSILILVGVFFYIKNKSVESEIYKTKGYAINGYDVLSFFSLSKPIIGNDLYVYLWKNAKWKFTSQDNLEEFKKFPEKYAPQFGGYCSYGVSNRYKAPTEIETWTIVDEKLYFNYNQSVKDEWMKNPNELIDKADKNWQIIKNKNEKSF